MGNSFYVLLFLILVAVIVLIAVFSEKFLSAKAGKPNVSGLKTRTIAMVGLFAAMSAVLSLFEVPVPFAPPFYKLDLAELPVLIISFAFGPFAGVMTELVRLLLKLFFKGTTSAFVGAIANLVIGSAFIIPASVLYIKNKTKQNALIGCISGTFFMALAGSLCNIIFLIPAYAVLYGMPLEKIIAMGTAVNARIVSLNTLVLFAVLPFNLLKGILVSALTMLLYKRISPVLKKQ